MLAFCSEPSRYARRVRAGRSLSFPVLGDPQNTLAYHLIDEGIVPGLLVVDRFDRQRTVRNQTPGNVPPATWQFYARHPYMSKYKEGVVQPCVAIVRGKGDAGRSVPYACAVNELRVRNGMGAGDRPRARDVWAAFVAHEVAGAAPSATMDGSRIPRHTVQEEPYLQVALFAHAAAGGALLLYVTGAITAPARNALLGGALAFALAYWHAFFRSIVAQKLVPPRGKRAAPSSAGLRERLAVIPRFVLAMVITKLHELRGNLGRASGTPAPQPQLLQKEHNDEKEQKGCSTCST